MERDGDRKIERQSEREKERERREGGGREREGIGEQHTAVSYKLKRSMGNILQFCFN